MTIVSDTILTEIKDRLATVTLNRPEKLNALNTELLDALPGVLQPLANDPQVRCVILTGAGLSLALACDIRIAAESARVGTAFARVGFSGDFGGTWMLQRLVGPARARELYFTADMIDAREAERLGIVNRAVPDNRLREETMALAAKITSGPPIALARMKQNMNLALASDYSTLLQAEAEGMIMTGMTQDHLEAAKAFLEKRPPVFEGR